MLEKINTLSIKAYLAVKSLFPEKSCESYRLRDDERGVSPVVATVLLILVAVLAALMVWTFLGEYIQKLINKITENSKLDTKNPSVPDLGSGG